MPAIQRHWTTAEVRDLMDESRHWPRYELIAGELIVTPAPGFPHQIAIMEIALALNAFLDRQEIGFVLTSPADLELQAGTITQPDVFVVPRSQAGESGKAATWADVTSLLLAVEIISPSSVRTDRIAKRDFYMESPVAEYWIVDLDARMVERWTPSRERPEILRRSLEWRPPEATTPLTLDLVALFDRIYTKHRQIRGR